MHHHLFSYTNNNVHLYSKFFLILKAPPFVETPPLLKIDKKVCILLWLIKEHEGVNGKLVNQLKRLMQVEMMYVKCMQTNFGGHSFSGFVYYAPFQKGPNFPFRPL